MYTKRKRCSDYQTRVESMKKRRSWWLLLNDIICILLVSVWLLSLLSVHLFAPPPPDSICVRIFHSFHLLMFLILMRSRNPCTVYFTAFFSVTGKKIWKQIWIPHTIFYKVSWLLRFTVRFGDTNHDFWTISSYSLFYINFHGQKNLILVIPIKDLVNHE